MMMMPMMGGMMMMQDPETMKIIREHQMQCKRELMRRDSPIKACLSLIEEMIHILRHANPGAVKKDP
ncbi:MAG: hypothetical protein Q9N34_01075 [Aquificota bacterium]|nr:hypothetical protein [Aquificota bacterium]